MTFKKPGSGSRVEVFVCNRCRESVRIKLWSPGALLRLRLLAILIIPAVFLAFYLAPCRSRQDPSLLSLLGLPKLFALFGGILLAFPFFLISWWNPEYWSWCGTTNGVSNVSKLPSSYLDKHGSGWAAHGHRVFHEDITNTEANAS